jgi:hypothetical protein
VATAAAVLFATASGAAFAQDDPAEPPQTGVTGVLYADKNGNGQQDSGEAISGGVVTLAGQDNAEHKATSDVDGKFALPGLAPGTYKPSYALAGGWVVHHAKPEGDLVTVTENTTTELVARAERPYSEQFRVFGFFHDNSYFYPTSVTTTLILINSTDHPISGIQARCDRKNAPGALGHGPAWDVLRGEGITLEAGGRRSLTIVDDVPESAGPAGKVTLDCDFAPNAGWNTDGPVLHQDAPVITGRGKHTMILGEDRNANSSIDADEAISGVKILLHDLTNPASVLERTSGPDGKIEFVGLEKTDYRVEVRAPWAFASDGPQFVRASDHGGSSVRFLKHLPPEDVRATVEFSKPRFESHELVQWDLTLTNAGGESADVWVQGHSPDLDVPRERWEQTWSRFASLAPGESRTFTISGKVRDYRNGKVRVSGSYGFSPQPNTPVKPFYGEVEIVQTKGALTGLVYLDKNNNGQPDPGEAAAGAVVEANGGAPYGYYKATTDAEGRYSFSDLPAGDYSVGYTLAGGWIVHFPDDVVQKIRVEPGRPVQLVAGAQRPYAEVLKATAQFDKTSYAVGEEVKITVKLTNTGGYVINDVHAHCNPDYQENHLGSRHSPSESWGDLRPGAKGVTVGPGETVTVVVTELVPSAGRSRNRVELLCEVAPRAEFGRDFALAYDWASVPGGRLGSLNVLVAYDKDEDNVIDPGDAIGNVRVRLMSHRENGFLVAEATTDAWGWARFTEIPLGTYWMKVDGPWKFRSELDEIAVSVSGGVGLPICWMVPGPDSAQPDTGDQPATVGPGGGGTKVALARTGASVLGLAFLGALLVVAGAALRRSSRHSALPETERVGVLSGRLADACGGSDVGGHDHRGVFGGSVAG